MRSQRRSQSARQERRESGEQRNAAWRELSSTDQLHALDGRLGKGVGAQRQRKKLTPVPIFVPTETPTGKKSFGTFKEVTIGTTTVPGTHPAASVPIFASKSEEKRVTALRKERAKKTA
jgi:hypothetical protein